MNLDVDGLGSTEQHVLLQLRQQVLDEEKNGGGQPLWTILKVLVNLPGEEQDKVIEVYERHVAESSQDSSTAAQPEEELPKGLLTDAALAAAASSGAREQQRREEEDVGQALPAGEEDSRPPGGGGEAGGDDARRRGGEEEQDGAVYCQDCEMWLNGPTQWEDHKFGKKHKKNLQRKQQGGPTPRAKTANTKKKKPASGAASGGGCGEAPAARGDAGSEAQPHHGPQSSEQEQPRAAWSAAPVPATGYYPYPVAMIPASYFAESREQQFMWEGQGGYQYPPYQGGGGGGYQHGY